MDKKDNGFLKRLLATFKIEAQEHVNALSSGLVDLEKAETAEKQMEITEAVFREAHSLKGAARAVNVTEIEVLCQSLESVFAALKRQEIASSSELFDMLHEAVDSLGNLLSSLSPERTASEKARQAELIQRLKDAASGIEEQRAVAREPETRNPKLETVNSKLGTPPSDTSPQSPMLTETVRVPTSKLTSILLQAEELLLDKLAAGQRVAELREVNSAIATWKKEGKKAQPVVQKFRHSVEKENKRNQNGKTNSQATKLLEFLDWNYSYIRSLENKLTALAMSAEHDHHSLSRLVDNLLQDMKKALMLPFSSLLEVSPKLVRELSRDQGKEVELVIHGGDIEIDRRILEEMKEPLIHLVRNCIDHGIENPKERVGKRKPPKGVITIAIERKNGHAEILISDDGAGIDVAKVKTAAVRLGILAPEEAEKMADSEALLLVFHSGVTTSPIITDVSGRGLGLAIVREKVEKLGGIISFETYPAAGTTFRVILPLTLATFRGIIVRVSEHLFILPTANVERVVRVNRETIKTVENRETIELNGKAVSLVRLEDVLEITPRNTSTNSIDSVPAVVLASAQNRIAFLVDEVINEQEVLVKNLGKQLSRVRNVAGAAVLGTGKVVPILNVLDLMKSAVVRASVATVKPAVATTEAKEEKRQHVLVVEDSITARTLLKNILEAADYDVATAVDGVDAFTRLRIGEFDIVVSDVDMPRMNGFDLTTKIRSDKKTADLPVVLVTALESREDRERGIDVGANAYIIKSSFDQSNLLEVIKRLV